jgi:hypothetical protein
MRWYWNANAKTPWKESNGILHRQDCPQFFEQDKGWHKQPGITPVDESLATILVENLDMIVCEKCLFHWLRDNNPSDLEQVRLAMERVRRTRQQYREWVASDKEEARQRREWLASDEGRALVRERIAGEPA